MSDQAVLLPKWFSHRGQIDHSYTFWTMANYTTVDCLCFFDSDVSLWTLLYKSNVSHVHTYHVPVQSSSAMINSESMVIGKHCCIPMIAAYLWLNFNFFPFSFMFPLRCHWFFILCIQLAIAYCLSKTCAKALAHKSINNRIQCTKKVCKIKINE